MKIYVASKFENKDAVRAAYARLREDGHEITCDWAAEDATGLDGSALHTYLAGCAHKDLVGVQACDALVLLNHERGCGMFTEMGIALAGGKLVIVIDADKRPNIFFHLPNVVHARDLDDALHLLSTAEQLVRRPA